MRLGLAKQQTWCLPDLSNTGLISFLILGKTAVLEDSGV